jgi:hypothetical protein
MQLMYIIETLTPTSRDVMCRNLSAQGGDMTNTHVISHVTRPRPDHVRACDPKITCFILSKNESS